MNLTAQLTTITRESIVPKIFDQVTTEPSLFNYVMSNTDKSTGTKLLVPIKTTSDTQGGSYDVNDSFTSTMPNTRTNFEFPWTLHEQPVVVANPYISANAGKEAVLAYLGQQTDESWTDFKEMISNQLVGDGTGNGGKNMLGLQALIDDGTRVATYGTKTRATDTYAQANYTAAVGTLAIADLQTAYRDAERLGTTPDMIWTHTVVRDAYEDLVLPTLQSNVNLNKVTMQKPASGKGMQFFMDYGSSLLAYKGVPIFTDNHIASDELYMWNSKFMKFFMLPNKVYPGNKEFGVSFRDFEAPIDQDAQVGRFHLYGQWVNMKPDASSALDGIS